MQFTLRFPIAFDLVGVEPRIFDNHKSILASVHLFTHLLFRMLTLNENFPQDNVPRFELDKFSLFVNTFAVNQRMILNKIG